MRTLCLHRLQASYPLGNQILFLLTSLFIWGIESSIAYFSGLWVTLNAKEPGITPLLRCQAWCCHYFYLVGNKGNRKNWAGQLVAGREAASERLSWLRWCPAACATGPCCLRAETAPPAQQCHCSVLQQKWALQCPKLLWAGWKCLTALLSLKVAGARVS